MSHDQARLSATYKINNDANVQLVVISLGDVRRIVTRRAPSSLLE